MATRGTYQVDDFLFYNHWDNYPSGAASHLLDVVKTQGNFTPFSIIRGMPVSPAHTKFDGPAEHHYEIRNGMITHYKISDSEDKLIFQETDRIENWINRNLQSTVTFLLKEDPQTDPNDFIVVKLEKFQNRYMTVNMIIAEAKKRYEDAVRFFEKGAWGNSTSLFQESFVWFAQAGWEAKEFKQEYLQKFSPVFVEKYSHQNSSHFDSYVEGIIR